MFDGSCVWEAQAQASREALMCSIRVAAIAGVSSLTSVPQLFSETLALALRKRDQYVRVFRMYFCDVLNEELTRLGMHL